MLSNKGLFFKFFLQFLQTVLGRSVTEYKEHKSFYNALADQVIEFCTASGKDYHIKNGTKTD